jgi:hypothetical protein
MLKRGGLLSPGFRAVNAKFSVSNLWSISQAGRRGLKFVSSSSSLRSRTLILPLYVERRSGKRALGCSWSPARSLQARVRVHMVLISGAYRLTRTRP